MREEIIKIIFQVIIIFIFVGIFFFTYASYIEQKIVEKQVDDIVVDLVGDIKMLWPPTNSSLTYVKQQIASTKPTNLSAQDDEVKASNKIILDKAVKSITIITIVGVILIFCIFMYSKYRGEHIDYLGIIKNDFIILAFVASVEFGFLTFFAQNYRTIDSNFVKYKTLDTIANYY